MTNLIHRLEAAEGPSQELDRAIHEALSIPPVDVGGKYGSVAHTLKSIGYNPYTSSLDAAVSLVPEGMAYVLAESNLKSQGSAQVFYEKRVAQVMALSRDPETHMEIAATPALALCIAALKAREAGND